MTPFTWDASWRGLGYEGLGLVELGLGWGFGFEGLGLARLYGLGLWGLGSEGLGLEGFAGFGA